MTLEPHITVIITVAVYYMKRKASNIHVLSSILNEIGASEYLQVFIDYGVDDESLKALIKLKQERVSSIYGLSLDQAAAFAQCLSVVYSLDTLPPAPQMDSETRTFLSAEKRQPDAGSELRQACATTNLVQRLVAMYRKRYPVYYRGGNQYSSSDCRYKVLKFVKKMSEVHHFVQLNGWIHLPHYFRAKFCFFIMFNFFQLRDFSLHHTPPLQREF